MKKQRINREIALQYIYDFGFDEACNYWGINQDQLIKIIEPEPEPVPKIRVVAEKQIVVNPQIKEIINKNYSKLYKKYVSSESKLYMSQTTEDIFHNTLLKVMDELSEITEQMVLDQIDYRFKMIHFQTVKDQKSTHKTIGYANIEESSEKTE